MSNYKVRLIPISSVAVGGAADIVNTQVVFEVTPTFTENGAVQYSPLQPVHLPGSIQMYRTTDNRSFDITAVLVSRNSEDAEKNRQYLQRLRGWRYPYFGATDTITDPAQRSFRASGKQLADTTTAIERIRTEGVQLRGAPPDVLYLYAYSMYGEQRTAPTVNINRVPVVLANLSIEYPEDVDYVPVSVGNSAWEPFPVKIKVSVSLLETHSPREFERFDLRAYKSGTLANF